MKTVLNGETTVYLYADDEKEIVDGVTFLKSFGIDKIVIVGATESKNQLNFIKVNNIPVVVKQPYRFPQSVDSDPMETFAIAKKNVRCWNIS
jgi:DNA-binding LacI/PurR family transcriptional regulator